MKAERAARAVQLGDELGALAHCRFETFDLARRLEPVEWEGHTIGVPVQRKALADALAACQAFAAQPDGWLYLHGSYGAGKSHLAAATATALQALGLQTIYRSTPSLLDKLRAGYKDHTFDERMEAIQQADVLVLDDIGTEHTSGNADALLYTILNERYLHDRRTLLTSNIHPDDLPARLASRIAGHARCVWLPVSDYRRIGRGAE